jgi:hypothetical protein
MNLKKIYFGSYFEHKALVYWSLKHIVIVCIFGWKCKLKYGVCQWCTSPSTYTELKYMAAPEKITPNKMYISSAFNVSPDHTAAGGVRECMSM